MRAPASLHRLRRADEIQAGRETEAATGTGTARGIETEAEIATGAVIGTETETGIEGRALTAEAGNGRGRRSTVMGVEMRDDTSNDLFSLSAAAHRRVRRRGQWRWVVGLVKESSGDVTSPNASTAAAERPQVRREGER